MMSTPRTTQPSESSTGRSAQKCDFDVRSVRLEGPDKAVFEVFVPASLSFFEGHFEGNPIVPGVAQVILCERLARSHLKFATLGAAKGLQRLKFLAAIGPGETLHVSLSGRQTADEAAVQFSVLRGDTPCATGTLKFHLG